MDEEGSSDLRKKRNKKDVKDMAMTKETDLISELPDHIVHCILCFLPKKDVAVCSVLSKTWHAFWTTFPVSDLEFRQTLTFKPEFERFVHDSVLRQHNFNTRIESFKLYMSYDFHVHPLINLSLRMVILRGVKKLDIDFRKYYDLPPIILSAESLTALRLARCGFTLDRPSINWPFLREFSLYRASIHEEIVQNLHLTCPQLEKFSVVDCCNLQSVKLSGFTKLKKVKVKSMNKRVPQLSYDPVKKLEIDVPNLQILNFRGGDLECKIDVATCVNLQVLKLKSPTITERACQDFISNLHDLKVLILNCPLLSTIHIPNRELEKLEFSSKYLFDLIGNRLPDCTYTRRLHSFKYRFDSIGILGLVDRTRLQKVSIKLFEHGGLFPSNFCKLREDLVNFDQIKHLTLHIKFSCFTWYPPRPRKRLPIPAKIKHLKLKVDSSILLSYRNQASEENFYADIVDGLLWTCHPGSLYLMTGWGSNNEIVRFLCNKLMNTENGQVCCTSSNDKCWLHDLKGFEINHYNGNGVQKALTCVNLLESLQTFAPQEMIFFIFQW